MPQMSTFSWIVWIAHIVVQSALVGAMLKTGTWRRWSALFSYLAFQSIHALSLFGIVVGIKDLDLQACVYFYVYWIGTFAAQIIEVWIIIQIALDLAGISNNVRRWLCDGVIILA